MQSRTHQGLVRSNNEDVALAEVLPDGARLLAVADGVGGTRGGEIASAAAIEGLFEQLRERTTDDPAEALRAAFQLANGRVREAAAGRPELVSMATTLVAGLVRDGEAWLANVGDSRAYLIRDSRAERLTEDHSWVDEQIKKGLLAADDPLASSFRNIVTRMIGADETVEVDTYGPVQLPPGGALLLCSDGLHGAVRNESIADAFAGASEGVTERLVQLALDAGGPDNVSVAVLNVEG